MAAPPQPHLVSVLVKAAADPNQRGGVAVVTFEVGKDDNTMVLPVAVPRGSYTDADMVKVAQHLLHERLRDLAEATAAWEITTADFVMLEAPLPDWARLPKDTP